MIKPEKFWIIFSKKIIDVKNNLLPDQSFKEIFRRNHSYTCFIDLVIASMHLKIKSKFKNLVDSKHITEYYAFEDKRHLDYYLGYTLNNSHFNISIEHENSYSQNVQKEELPKLFELDESGKSNLSVLFWSYCITNNNIDPQKQIDKIIQYLLDKELKSQWLVILCPGYRYNSDYDEYLKKIKFGNWDYKAYEISYSKDEIICKSLDNKEILSKLL